MYNFADVTRKLVIKTQSGLTANGKAKTKTSTFTGLSETASAEAVNQAAEAIAGLMNGPVVSIQVDDKNEVLDN